MLDCDAFCSCSVGGHFGIARSVRLSVPWRSCLQLGHRRSPEVCGLRTRPRTDVDPPRFLDRAAISGGHIVSPPPGRCLVVFSDCVSNSSRHVANSGEDNLI